MMFGNKRSPVFNDQVETIIGRDTQVTGTINATGTIRVDGHVDGKISTKGDIVVGETGYIKAEISARSATIAGELYGDVDVVDKLELAPTGKLYGDIKTGTLIIGEGAIFKGACQMRHGNEKNDVELGRKEIKANLAKS